MKLSTLQLIAIFSILTVGFMTVAPVVQTAEAGETHTIPVYVYAVTTCENCGNAISWVLISVGQATVTHGANEPHNNMFIVITIKTPNGLCNSCQEETSS